MEWFRSQNKKQVNFMRKTLLAVAVATTVGSVYSHAAVIKLNDVGGVTGSAAQLGFNVAAAYWGSILTNNAVINLDVRFAALPTNVIGSTGSRAADFAIADWQAAFNATKSNSTIDQTAVLPTLTNGGISGFTVGVDAFGDNDTTVTAILDGTQTSSQTLWSNTSVIKAVGGAVSSPNTADGSMTFSSTFAFDFDPTDGIEAGTFDFLGVAIHEMGHALGFVSGVDFFDYWSYPNGPGRGFLGYDLNDTSLFSALDMYRYSAPGVLDYRTGGNPYFSIDGGVTALFGNNFATGRFNGDGDQASHWKDLGGCSGQLGIMDPNFCFGQMGEITGLDLASFDAMGWNLSVDALTYQTQTSADIFSAFAVPAPATWTLVLGTLGLMGVARRGRQPAGESSTKTS